VLDVVQQIPPPPFKEYCTARPLQDDIVSPEIVTVEAVPKTKPLYKLFPLIVSTDNPGPVMVTLRVIVGSAEVSVITPVTVNAMVFTLDVALDCVIAQRSVPESVVSRSEVTMNTV